MRDNRFSISGSQKFGQLLICYLLTGAAIVTSTSAVPAQTFWRRTHSHEKHLDSLLLGSVERVIEGNGDTDDLRRARLSLTSLLRGRISDPWTAILLVRLHRELGLLGSQKLRPMLRQSLDSVLTSTQRARAHLELAYLSQVDPHAEDLSAHLQAALVHAWRPQDRAQIHLIRAWSALRGEAPAQAIRDFSSVDSLAHQRGLLLQSAVGRALALALQGDFVALGQVAMLAHTLEEKRAKVSRKDPFVHLGLDAGEKQAVRFVFKWGTYLEGATTASPEEADVSRVSACAVLGLPASAKQTRRCETLSLEQPLAPTLPPVHEPACGEKNLIISRVRAVMTEACTTSSQSKERSAPNN